MSNYSYLHINGFIHRDVKAANLLIDDDGTVLLGDLGVAASLCDEEPVPVPSGSGAKLNFDGSIGARASDNSHLPRATKKLGKRKSFVGTVSHRTSMPVGLSLTVSCHSVFSASHPRAIAYMYLTYPCLPDCVYSALLDGSGTNIREAV